MYKQIIHLYKSKKDGSGAEIGSAFSLSKKYILL